MALTPEWCARHAKDLRDLAKKVERNQIASFVAMSIGASETEKGVVAGFRHLDQQGDAGFMVAALVAILECSCGDPRCDIVVFQAEVLKACAKFLGPHIQPQDMN